LEEATPLTLKALDLFCGLGGWSDGLASEGFKVLGVEIEPKIAKLYKHPVLVEDVRNLNGKIFRDFTLIVGSPPCRDFSVIGNVFGHTWKRPPDPKGEGMSLVKSFLSCVKSANPKYWLLENVPKLQKYIGPAKVETFLGVNHMRRCFWGNFPTFLIPKSAFKIVYPGHWDKDPKRNNRPNEGRIFNIQGKYRKWERAKIPLPLAKALGKAIKNDLETRK